MIEASDRERIRGVLFDATGTLIDTRERVGKVYARLAQGVGVDAEPTRLDEAFGDVLSNAPPRVFPGCTPSDTSRRERDWWRTVVRETFRAADPRIEFADFAAFFEELYAYYQTEAAWTLRVGAREALLALAQNPYRVGLVSNFDQRLSIILQALDVNQFFDVVMIPALCGAEKPDPRIFQAALSELNLPARSVVYVGDDPDKDLAAARCAGLDAVDVRGLASLADLAARIEDMNGARMASVTDKAR